MTTNKPSKRNTCKKETPKRAVSFSPNVKPEAPSRLRPKTDGDLQSVDKRRRYLRRGSKCPSMLRASFLTMSPLLQGHVASDPSLVGDFSLMTNYAGHDLKIPGAEKQLMSRGSVQRRMSLMTALKSSLENASIVDNGPAPMKVERRLSTMHLLSQA